MYVCICISVFKITKLTTVLHFLKIDTIDEHIFNEQINAIHTLTDEIFQKKILISYSNF